MAEENASPDGLRVLLVEDDRSWRRRAQEYLGRNGIEVDAMPGAEEALEALERMGAKKRRELVVLLDLNLVPGRMQGSDLLSAICSRWPEAPPPVIVLSVQDDFSTLVPLARRWMHRTPRVLYDYQNKRYGFCATAESIADSYERLAHAIHLVHLEHHDGGKRFVPPFLVGISREIRAVFREVRLFASSAGTPGAQVPVLVLGATGTGKEIVARLLHFFSVRRDGPFLAVNCAALPETLLESELFGSLKGAFTGAEDRAGLFEAAGGGTLFLDEIGEMTPTLQAKLLRVLEQGRVRRVGDAHEREVDTRVVAATNRRIEAMVQDGRFREDLWYRLGMLRIDLPPLRDRRGDIELLATSFVLKHLGIAPGVRDVDAGALREVLSEQPWPGNVRELEGVVMKALIFAGASPDGILGHDHLVAAIGRRGSTARHAPAAASTGAGLATGDQSDIARVASEHMARLADSLLEDIVAGRRPPASLADIEVEFHDLGIGRQLVTALERRFERQGLKRRNPTDEEARLWFGYSGASSWRRWVTSLRRSRRKKNPPQSP